MIYSHSRLSTFEQCPYKYKLKYIEKVPSDIPDTIETFLGSRVHETLEKLYRDLDHKKINSIEDLIHYFQQQWQTHWSDDIIIVKKEYTKDHYQKMGETYIREYYRHYHPFDQDRTIAIEGRILIDLDDTGDYKLQGYIDRLSEQQEGYFTIHDYKTNERLPTKDHFNSDRQLALYAIGVKNQYHNVKEIDLTWHFLKFDKEITSKRTDQQLQNLKKETLDLIKKIENTTSFQTNPSFLCNWCEYKPICPQWSHLYALKEQSTNPYLEDDGAKLVDRYAALKQKTNQMKLDLYAEIEKLEQALISYAKKNDLEVVFGSENQVRIKKQQRYSIPAKNSSTRNQLETLLKKQGKWDEVGQLDTSALNKILMENQWDDELIGLIKHYVKYTETPRIYLAKKKDQ